MSFSSFETELGVRPDDIDFFQHVHNSKYFDYVLAARYDQMARCYGMSMESFMERGYGWVVKQAMIEYKRPLRLGDVIVVRTRVAEFFKDGVRVEFEIIKKVGGKTSSLGWCLYTLIDLATGRARELPTDVVEKYSI